MAKKKITLETLTAKMRKGFGWLSDKIQKIDDRMEKGFAAVAGDIADIKRDMATKDDIKDLEKRLGDRIDGVKVNIDGVQKTVDQEALVRADLQLPRRVHELEEEVFGHSKHPKHLPL